MNLEDYVPEGAVKAVLYANCLFWYDDNNEIITQDRNIKIDYLEKLLTLTREQAGIIRTGVGEQYQNGFIENSKTILLFSVDESTQVFPCACVFSSATSRRR